MFSGDILGNLVNIGFVLLVTAACLRSFFSSEARLYRNAQHWKRELREVEEALRALIQEASSASYHLDRNLLQRQQELTNLLQRFEQNRGAEVNNDIQDITLAEEYVINSSNNSAASSPINLEVPNDSWLKPLKRPSNSEEKDTARQIQRPISKAAASQELLSQIEVSKAATSRVGSPEPSFRGRSELAAAPVIDPAAYKVARRLLASGQEIHVVARKVGLPVEEVRVLDHVIRDEQQAREEVKQETLREADDSASRLNADIEVYQRNGKQGAQIERELAFV